MQRDEQNYRQNARQINNLQGHTFPAWLYAWIASQFCGESSCHSRWKSLECLPACGHPSCMSGCKDWFTVFATSGLRVPFGAKPRMVPRNAHEAHATRRMTDFGPARRMPAVPLATGSPPIGSLRVRQAGAGTRRPRWLWPSWLMLNTSHGPGADFVYDLVGTATASEPTRPTTARQRFASRSPRPSGLRQKAQPRLLSYSSAAGQRWPVLRFLPAQAPRTRER
jgi:hypothetical protein